MEAGPQLPQEYSRATQRITGTLWMCINTALVLRLDSLGLGCHIPALRDVLMANSLRAAAAEQRASAGGVGWVGNTLASEDAFLALALEDFGENLVVFRWRGAVVEAALRFSDLALDTKRRVQRAEAPRLRADSAAAGEAAVWTTLHRRAARWDPDRAEELAEVVRGAMMCDAPEELRCSLLRSFL